MTRKVTYTTKFVLQMVKATKGFSVGHVGETAKVTNTETNEAISLHTSSRSGYIRRLDVDRLKDLGWTQELYESQQIADRARRMRGHQVVTHRINEFMEKEGLFQGPSSPTREGRVIPSPDAYAHESGETMTVEEIGPELARKYLDTVSILKGEDGRRKQRRASAAVIQDYADKMTRGEWVRTHQTIAFADGHLIDGQQRMAAVELSQTVQSFWVARGFTHGIFAKTDKGKGRTVNDTFFVEGFDKSADLVPILRYCFLIDHVADQRKWPKTKVSDDQHLDMMPELKEKGYPDPRESVLWAKASRTSKLIGSAIATAHYLITRANPSNKEEVDAWFEQLRWGAGLNVGDPIFALRNWAAASDTRRTVEKNLKVPKQLLHLYLILMAWNNTQEGRRINQPAYQVPVTIPAPEAYIPPGKRKKRAPQATETPFNNQIVNNPPTD